MTTTDMGIEIDWNKTFAAPKGTDTAVTLPEGVPTNTRDSNCSNCGKPVKAGAGFAVDLGGRITTRCAGPRCIPAGAVAPVAVAPVPQVVTAAPQLAGVPTPAAPAPARVTVWCDVRPDAIIRTDRLPDGSYATGRVAVDGSLIGPYLSELESVARESHDDYLRIYAPAPVPAPVTTATLPALNLDRNRFADTCGCGLRMQAGAGFLVPVPDRTRRAAKCELCARKVLAAMAPAPVAPVAVTADTAPAVEPCDDPSLTEAPATADDVTAPVVAVDAGLAGALADAVTTGQTMAAGFGLVRGGVLPEQVRSVGVVPEARANMLVNSEASAAAIGGTTERAASAARPAAPTVVHVQPQFTGEVRTGGGISAVFAAALNVSRARQGTLKKSGTAVRVDLTAAPQAVPAAVAAQYDAVTQTRTERAGLQHQALKIQGAITAGTVVAGARSEADGFMIGWGGKRERTRAQLIAALAVAGMPTEWAPASKSARAHAGRAVAAADAWTWGESRLITRAAASTEIETAAVKRGVVARWTMQSTRAATGQVGESAGRIVLTVELVRNGNGDMTIETNGDSHLGARVVKEFDRLADGEIYKASDVTAWLARTLNGKLGAVDYGPSSHYIRSEHVAAAEALCAALKGQGWGVRWILPALPITTGEELRAGLVDSFAVEAREVVKRAWNLLTVAREKAAEKVEAAKKAGKRGAALDPAASVSAGSAESLRKELMDVAARASQYESLLGTDAVSAVADEIRAAMVQIETMCDDTAARGFMLELD